MTQKIDDKDREVGEEVWMQLKFVDRFRAWLQGTRKTAPQAQQPVITAPARLQATQEAFDNIYRQDLWALRSGEYSAEKPGMESEHARNTRLTVLIQDFLRLNDIKSVVEFGCGYFGYASQVDWSGVEYDGYDIVEEVIESNRQYHAKPNVRFHVVRDGTRMPKADLLISKDVLQHLPTEDVQYYLSLFKTNFRFMLIGNDCYPDDNLNGTTPHGGYRALRLELPPFNYPNIVVQQWKCVEFGTFIVKNFCLFQGEPKSGDNGGIVLRDNRANHPTSLSPPHVRDVVGLQDGYLGGWGKGETGELFEGFCISPADTVVDIGCGDGAFAGFAGQQGASVTFIDVDALRLQAATQLLRETPAKVAIPILSDCNPIPLADGIATRVICTEVLEHVPDAQALMAEIVRIGAPGALYLLSVPHPFAESLQKALAPAEYFAPPYHVRVFTREDFETLVGWSGLVVDRWHADGFFWALHAAMMWSCDADGKPHHTLDTWAECWSTLLATKDGRRVKAALDAAAPNKQIIVAHKPTSHACD